MTDLSAHERFGGGPYQRLARVLSDAAGTSETMQLHLGDIASGTAKPDLMLLQAADRLTQTLTELAAMLAALAGKASSLPPGWDAATSAIALADLRNALADAPTSTVSDGAVDLF
ncbi:MAG: hypothetical protein Q4F71_01850 [Paracoccus sp. (in: a-proteobacteria)]|nr:hypothetical protein [Paracoccus sp. (in: a-proteobacteria)]